MTKTTDAPEPTPKRANGEGGVFFWEGRGWYASITDNDGRRVMRKAPKQSRAGAEQHLRKLLNDREENRLVGKTTTLKQFVPDWLRAVKLRGCRPRTLESYEEKITRYIVPTLGKLRLDKLTAAHIERVYEAWREAGVSNGTLTMVHANLHNLLKLAKKRRLVGHIATDDVDAPRPEKYVARSFTLEEARKVLVELGGHRHGPLWTFILGTGCRFGEAAGLRWSDVELDGGMAAIRQQVTKVKTDEGVKLIFDRVKTDAGRRDAPLAPFVIVALKTQRAKVAEMRLVAGAQWHNHDLVFPNTTGGPLRENHVLVTWHRALKRIGLPPVRLHDLRHTKGTLMIDEGEELVVVQRTLGHARQSITADIYVGKVPKALRKAADRFGALLESTAAASS